VLDPPVLERYCIATLFEGDTTIIACRELAAADSRIMTPILAQPPVLSTEATRATIEPSARYPTVTWAADGEIWHDNSARTITW
jgi:hypothetical protein